MREASERGRTRTCVSLLVLYRVVWMVVDERAAAILSIHCRHVPTKIMVETWWRFTRAHMWRMILLRDISG